MLGRTPTCDPPIRPTSLRRSPPRFRLPAGAESPARELMAAIVADRLVAQLGAAGLVVMQSAPLGGHATRAGHREEAPKA
jgi:hypothetical protein